MTSFTTGQSSPAKSSEPSSTTWLAGAILVVVVLLVLLGNLRAGLLVAIVIPLAMLFAVMGMYRFSIAASLLSLGAIDFGILVDGSVVMTESNMRRLAERTRKLGRRLTARERLDIVLESARQVARPIAFGMAIIAVVFVPVLTLEGMEGKMFRPMAWTFIFALGRRARSRADPLSRAWLLLSAAQADREGRVASPLGSSRRTPGCLRVPFGFRWVTLEGRPCRRS